VTIVGAISPPGGDFADPVTTQTLSIVQVFWGLDKKLAQRKHFPSVNWSISFAKTDLTLKAYYQSRDATYLKLAGQFRQILQDEKNLLEIVQLIGKDSLDEEQKVTLEVAKLIRDDYLNQNSFTPYDYNCPLAKTSGMLRNLCKFYDLSRAAVGNVHSEQTEHKVTWSRIRNTLRSVYDNLVNMKFIPPDLDPAEIEKKLAKQLDDMVKAFAELQHA